jgi:small subunit ribosomal protein S6
MRSYEITFVVDPVLSGEEIKATAQTYVDRLQNEGCTIIHVDEMGLRQLAYPINKRTTGIYYCVEYQATNGDNIDPLELAMRRDERVMRFLSVKLDKYGVKYNQDKRDGKIGKVKRKVRPEPKSSSNKQRRGSKGDSASASNQPNKPHGDNLKRIEGIGPKISEALKASGITTYGKLSEMNIDDIKKVLDEAGDRFQNQDPSTWPKQAELASAGEWDKLKAWQEDLKAGRMPVAKPATSNEEEE